MDDEPLQEDLRHDFSEALVIHFGEEVKQKAAKPVGMGRLDNASASPLRSVDGAVPSGSRLTARYDSATTPGSVGTNRGRTTAEILPVPQKIPRYT